MIHSTLNSILILKVKDKIPKKNYLIMSIIIGIFFPDIDFVISWFLNIMQISYLIDLNLENSLLHSIFIIPFISLIILIYSEYKKNKMLINVAIGLSIGIFIHILFDILTFQSVGILYPLFDSNFNLSNYFIIELSENFKKKLNACEFIFFRFYGWFIINEIIKKPLKNYDMIKKVTIWMKLELYIFLLLLLFIYFDVNEVMFKNTFDIFYILSITFIIYITFKIRNTLY